LRVSWIVSWQIGLLRIPVGEASHPGPLDVVVPTLMDSDDSEDDAVKRRSPSPYPGRRADAIQREDPQRWTSQRSGCQMTETYLQRF
jgi:hypothetical protein